MDVISDQERGKPYREARGEGGRGGERAGGEGGWREGRGLSLRSIIISRIRRLREQCLEPISMCNSPEK